jgi:hypothetical protein
MDTGPPIHGHVSSGKVSLPLFQGDPMLSELFQGNPSGQKNLPEP